MTQLFAAAPRDAATLRLIERLQALIDVAGQSVELSDWPELQKALEDGRAIIEELS
jgi:hypothetical protein